MWRSRVARTRPTPGDEGGGGSRRVILRSYCNSMLVYLRAVVYHHVEQLHQS